MSKTDYLIVEDQTEALKIKLAKKNSSQLNRKFIEAIEIMSTGAVLFIPDANPNTVTQYRHWMSVKLQRRLRTRSGERDGVKGLYMWAGEDR